MTAGQHPLTSSTTIGHVQHTDVQVAEVRRPRAGDPTDHCYVEFARGNVSVQWSGTLRELQLVAVAITDGLVAIGQARGMESR